MLQNTENSCVFVLLQVMMMIRILMLMMMIAMMADRFPRSCLHLDTLPHPLRRDAGSGGRLQVDVPHVLTYSTMAMSRSNLAILLYLTLDAAHLGVLSAFWAAAFLTERMPRMVTIIMMIVQ